MSIVSKLQKEECEYTSPDGEVWNIIYISSEGRKYVKMKRSTDADDKYTTVDLQMLLDLSDKLRPIKINPSLMEPAIKDHRSMSPIDIQNSVDESMRQQDSTIAPIQSFSAANDEMQWANLRSGFDITSVGEAKETPAEYKYEASDDAPEWQKEVVKRKTQIDNTKDRPVVVKYGNSGKGFQRNNGGSRVKHSEIL